MAGGRATFSAMEASQELSANAGPPSRCAECGTLLSDALVLACGHDLCLRCAATALRQTRSSNGPAVQCWVCRCVTELCEEAAAALAGSSTSAPTPAPTHSNGYGAESRGAPAQRMARIQPMTAGGLPAPRPLASTMPASTMPATIISQADVCSCGSVFTADATFCKICGARRPTEVNPPLRVDSPSRRERSSVGAGSPTTPPRTPRIEGRSATSCMEHPDEPATYFCATCECACICAECIVHGRHQGHEVMRVGRAHEALRARAGALLDEALALEDDFAVVTDKLAWRRKDIERAAARGRASVRSAFARVRAQLADRESELLESLDSYESDSLKRLERSSSDHDSRLGELRRLQESLRARCRGGEPVEALNAYASAKAAIVSLRDAFRQDELTTAAAPEEFVGLASSARAELDLHAEGLASLEEAVASLCERGVDFLPQAAPSGPAAHMRFQADSGRGGVPPSSGGDVGGLAVGSGGSTEAQHRREALVRERDAAARAGAKTVRRDVLGQRQRFREELLRDSPGRSRPIMGPPVVA